MDKLKEFWDKLSSREKVALGVLVAGVVGYAFYKRSKNSSSSSSPGANVGQPVDQYGNPLYPTNLSGVYSQQPGGNFSTGTGTTTTPGTGGTSTTTLPPRGFLGPPSPVPSSKFITGGPTDTLQGIAAANNLSIQQLYALNPWAGTLNGNYAAGGNYNPNLPGDVNGLQVRIG